MRTLVSIQMSIAVGPTYASQLEKGTPLSRANDHNCLEAVAVSAMQQAVRVMIIIVTRTLVAA